MKTTIIALFLLVGSYSSTAFDLQNGVYKLSFASPDCNSSFLASFLFTPSSGSCSDTNTTGCVTTGQYESFSRSCGSPPQQVLDFKQSTWVIVKNTTTGTNCTTVQWTTGARANTVFRTSPSRGYTWSCSNTTRTYLEYDTCSPTSCVGSGGVSVTFPNKMGVCNANGNIYFCDDLNYVQQPLSPVAAPVMSTPESLPSPAAQSPNSNVAPTSENNIDGAPLWAVTLLIIAAVVIVSLIVAMVMLYIRHKRNSYTRIHDEGELPVNNLPRALEI